MEAPMLSPPLPERWLGCLGAHVVGTGTRQFLHLQDLGSRHLPREPHRRGTRRVEC